jgi:D-tyrosyl-tRNA(Tyr) deacylase
MRAVIQRVIKASVSCSSGHFDEINSGLIIFLGIESVDNEEDVKWLSGKISRLRIFDDQDGIMNLGLDEFGGELLVISQFTLHASTKKGNRPSYARSAPPVIAQPLYDAFLKQIENDSKQPVKRGVFGDDMKVSLINDGPVTIFIDTKSRE